MDRLVLEGAAMAAYIACMFFIFLFVQNMIVSKQPSTTITMSPGMTSAIFQESLMAHILDLKSKAFNVVAQGQTATAKPQQKHLFFIDDLNTAPQNHGTCLNLILLLFP